MRFRASASIALLTLLGLSTEAHAFCRARTCNPANPKQACEKDDDGCVTSGRELFWGTSCLTFDAQEDGSAKLGIDADTLTAAITQAFAPWLRASCGTAGPALEVGTFGPVSCDWSGFNEEARNANIVMFRDEAWPYPGSMDPFAMTRVSFNTDTGEIVDADIEINSAQFEFTTDGSGTGVDLQTVLTHEAGHFLGLSHTAPENADATMRIAWNGQGTELRTLSADDEAGICELFPAQARAPRKCEPIHGFGSGCNEESADAHDDQDGGCALVRRKPDPSAALGLLLLTFLTRLRRAARRLDAGARSATRS
jgi:hypothetical protein